MPQISPIPRKKLMSKLAALGFEGPFRAPMATSKYPTYGRVKIPQRQVKVVY